MIPMKAGQTFYLVAADDNDANEALPLFGGGGLSGIGEFIELAMKLKRYLPVLKQIPDLLDFSNLNDAADVEGRLNQFIDLGLQFADLTETGIDNQVFGLLDSLRDAGLLGPLSKLIDAALNHRESLVVEGGPSDPYAADRETLIQAGFDIGTITAIVQAIVFLINFFRGD